MGRVLGVDLSGPSNTADTAAARFAATDAGLVCEEVRAGLGDADLLALATSGASGPVVGLDAPLAYQPGGGDRPGDRALRARVQAAGLPPGSVMTPTMTRMAYLTLRGIAVARALALADPGARIVEVHPGAAMVLRGAPVDAVRAMKSDAGARRTLVGWLGGQGLADLPGRDLSDHEIAACAAALGAWRWSEGDPVWVAKASGPLAPYDYAC